MKKITILFSIFGFLTLSMVNCFGQFGLTRSIYRINAGINIGSGKVAGFFRSLLFLFPFSIGYYFAMILDVLLFNLIEFWTGSNPVSKADFNEKGERVTMHKAETGETIELTELKWGEEMDVRVTQSSKTVQFHVFKSKPGQIFQKENGVWVPKKDMEGPLPIHF